MGDARAWAGTVVHSAAGRWPGSCMWRKVQRKQAAEVVAGSFSETGNAGRELGGSHTESGFAAERPGGH